MDRQITIPQRTNAESGTCTMFVDRNYASFIEYMNRNFIRKMQGVICDTDADYVRTFKLKHGTAGNIFEIRCPESQSISIFSKCHTISLRCFDKNNREPAPSTRVNFKKVSRHGGTSRHSRATYGDLSNYSFPEGLYLTGKDVLELEVLNPDIDIEKIELSMESDIFEMFGQTC